MISAVLNNKLATLKELQTFYGTEDLFDLYELVIIKVANEQKSIEEARIKRK